VTILDTNVVSEFMAGSPSQKVRDWFARQQFMDETFVTAITGKAPQQAL
jgi:predicted nucleic acid-binding protein